MSTSTKQTIPFAAKTLHIFYSAIFMLFWVYSAITTPDLQNWLLENSLTLSFIIVLIAFYNIFRFSDTSYTLILLFLLLHVYGSQYQYSDNPFGEWLKMQFNFERNHYDRLVHLGFGLLLAYPMHEVANRCFKLKGILGYLAPIELTLSLSAIYELIEWLVADVVYESTQQGMDFLGMQGDIWDAQKDIAFALSGAIFTMVLASFLSKGHKKTSHT